MKNLYLTRGVPGCGKSTWIRANNFEPFTVSADDIRKLYPFRLDNTDVKISSYYDLVSREFRMQLVEKRLQLNQPVIIDATCITKGKINDYRRLANKYGYTVKIIDFSNVSLEQSIAQDKKRDIYSQVGETTINYYYKQMLESNEAVSLDYPVLSPELARDEIHSEIQSYINYMKGSPITKQELQDLLFTVDASDESFDKLVTTFPILEPMKHYDQNNKYHRFTLDIHTLNVVVNVQKYNDLNLSIAALFHDVGKIYTARIGKDGYCHYLGHHVTSARVFQDSVKYKLLDIGFSLDDVDIITYLIENHDANVDKVTRLKVELARLGLADALNHELSVHIQERIDMCKKYLT